MKLKKKSLPLKYENSVWGYATGSRQLFLGGGELNLNPLYGWSVEHTLPNILVKWARNPKHDQKPLKM